MVDIVERARHDVKVLEASTNLFGREIETINLLCDEIERLRAENQALKQTEGLALVRKAVIEDMREWAKSKGYADHTVSFPALDAYAKEQFDGR